MWAPKSRQLSIVGNGCCFCAKLDLKVNYSSFGPTSIDSNLFPTSMDANLYSLGISTILNTFSGKVSFDTDLYFLHSWDFRSSSLNILLLNFESGHFSKGIGLGYLAMTFWAAFDLNYKGLALNNGSINFLYLDSSGIFISLTV
jgi:hypothetical protein